VWDEFSQLVDVRRGWALTDTVSNSLGCSSTQWLLAARSVVPRTSEVTPCSGVVDDSSSG
jgi:hypothetical protein